jgi:hypothetical protein
VSTIDSFSISWLATTTLGSPSIFGRKNSLAPKGGSDLFLAYQERDTLVAFQYVNGSWSQLSTGGNEAWTNITGSMTSGVNGRISAMAVFNGDLIIGGSFTSIDGSRFANIARWNGYKWKNLGEGFNSHVFALTVHNQTLIAAGQFTTAGPTGDISAVAQWDGASWTSIGTVTINTGLGEGVFALHSDGNKLYAGGHFTTFGGAAANKIAVWDGASWAGLGTGLNGTANSISKFGTDIVVGGSFTQAGGSAIPNIAKWNGTSWSALGAGVDGNVLAVKVYNSSLAACGAFTNAGGVTVNKVALWNGSAWLPLGAGLSGGYGMFGGSNCYAIEVDGDNLYCTWSFCHV